MLPLKIEVPEENKIDFLQDWENELVEEKNNIQKARQNLKVLETKIKFRENLISQRENKLEQIEAEQTEREERLKISEETAEEIAKLAAVLDVQQEEVAKQKISLQTLQKELSKREEELQTKIAEQETLQVELLRKKLNSIRDIEMRNLKVELEKMRNYYEVHPWVKHCQQIGYYPYTNGPNASGFEMFFIIISPRISKRYSSSGSIILENCSLISVSCKQYGNNKGKISFAAKFFADFLLCP